MLITLKKTDYKLLRSIKPWYFDQLKKYPANNPIFITLDWHCLCYIRNHHGVCLFCKKSDGLPAYDFHFCHQHEIWILYRMEPDYIPSLELGRAIQLMAATKVLVMLLNSDLLIEEN